MEVDVSDNTKEACPISSLCFTSTMRAPALHCAMHCKCLVDLPLELIVAICAFVECRTIIRCRSVA